jgi:hypothetical protein
MAAHLWAMAAVAMAVIIIDYDGCGKKKSMISKKNYPNDDGAKIDGGRRHTSLGKGMIGKQQRLGGEGGNDNNRVFPPAIEWLGKNIKNNTISHLNRGGGHGRLLVSRLTGAGSAQNKAIRVEQQAQGEEGT